MVWSPDGTTLATGSKDTTIKLWDATTGNCQSTLSGHSGEVNDVSFSPDGTKLASCSDDWSVKIWNLITLEVVLTVSGHRYWQKLSY